MWNMSKQTAVEWLTQRLHNRRNGIFDGLPVLTEQQLCEQAKAMEREQRFKDFQGGFQAATDAIIAANKSVQSKNYGKEASHE